MKSRLEFPGAVGTPRCHTLANIQDEFPFNTNDDPELCGRSFRRARAKDISGRRC